MAPKPSTEFAKLIGRGFREKDKLTQGVVRHLMHDYDNGRRTGFLHPSELSGEHFCARKAFYDISGVVADSVPRNLAFEMVFQRGHDSHEKWQNWFWEMENLRGYFKCLSCKHKWYDRSPWSCPRCGADVAVLKYDEVPVFNEEYGIMGKADGDVWWNDHWTLIEIKTVGLGTVRFDAPKILERYTYTHVDTDGKERTGVDMEGLWKGIQRPFAAHLRQGMIYLFCTERKEIVYIYEPKFLTAHPKEFEIKFQPSLIEDVLGQCTKVRAHLQSGRPPKRPVWAEKTCRTCKECPFKKTCYGE